jgi:hypothetical protein
VGDVNARQPSSRSERDRNLDHLLGSRDELQRPIFVLDGDRPAALPQFASVVGVDIDAPFDAPHPVVLHETADRPVPLERPWMACYDLDTGDRL